MTKAEYLKDLEARIQRLPSQERADILADYREHFEMGLENGKSEEEISKSLGTPRSIAQSILMNNLVESATSAPTIRGRGEAIFRMLLLILVLAPFNFLILVGPFLVLFCLLLTGWVVPLSVAGGATAAGFVLIQAGLSGFGILGGLSLLSIWIGVLSTAFVVCVIMWLLTRGSLWLLIAFFKWNIEFITEKKR